MDKPKNLIPLIDGDILRYEIGFAAEVGWAAATEGRETIPPFSFVEKMLLTRINLMKENIGTTAKPRIFLTEGRTFRYDLAVTKPYKGTRVDKKPWHYNNLTVYMRDVLDAEVVTYIEADDIMAAEHVTCEPPFVTIICTRDKDLKQVPGWFYSWELGKQPSFGPELITQQGTLELSENKKKLNATGLAAFYGQVLTGDRVDNIPGLDGCGPVAAYDALNEADVIHKDHGIDMGNIVRDLYDNDELLLEQGRLCWMTRRFHEDGKPVLWEIGMEN